MEDFDELKKRAAEYYSKNQVPERIEEILNKMFYEDPKDINGRLAEFFETFSLAPVISGLKCNEILSSNGGPALKCTVHAIVKNHSQAIDSTQVSIHHETNYVQQQVYPEGVEPLTTEEIIEKNCKNINESISEKLSETPLYEQREVDKVLSDWLNSEECVEEAQTESAPDDQDEFLAPSPSSGKKKKGASAKQKASKIPDKPVPPKEPFEQRHPGFTSIIASSLAVLKSSATLLHRPAFEHLHQTMNPDEPITMPTVAMTILTGGKFAPGKLNLFKHVFAIAAPGTNIRDSIKRLVSIYQNVGRPASAKPGTNIPTGAYGAYQPSYDKFELPLDAMLEAVNAAGFVPGQDVMIGVDCAAHELFDYDKGKYEIIAGTMKTADDMVELYRDIIARYPAVVMIVNPLRKEDREQWPKLCEAISEKCFVIGGEAIFGSLHKFDVGSLTARPSSGVAITNGGRVTCSDLSNVVKDVKATSGVTILMPPPDDVCDDVYSDVGVGLGVDVVMFGAPSKAENTARINRMKEIEDIIEDDDNLSVSHHEPFTFPVIKPPPPPEVPTETPADDVTPAISTPDTKSKKK